MASDYRVRLVVGSLTRFVERSVKGIALNATANLNIRNPVDTGWSRANYIPRIGKPVDSAAGSKLDVGAAVRAMAVGIAQVVTGYKLSAGPVFITNHVPYVPDLNRGSSRQAPAGFIEEELIRAVEQTIQDMRGEGVIT